MLDSAQRIVADVAKLPELLRRHRGTGFLLPPIKKALGKFP